ncbi:cysteine desulfurase-like protein [Haliangium sp.]|uniref:cysteine desulfurase-like protein n=1 Tax=Haliangium sp. TaxID=2663208 RepID=UPI003D0EFA92
MTFDPELVRGYFGALRRDWALFDNAGGSAVPLQVVRRVTEHLSHRPVQLGASYELSVEATDAVQAGIAAAAVLVGAGSDEVVLGPSTTMNVYVLAQALAAGFSPGDEIVVTNLDHEANVGAWRRLADRGLVIREWRFRPETMTLELDDLDPLLNERTRLVCCTHVSNVVGAIHDVGAISERVHAAGARLCVDGVAYAPHRRVDVKAWDVDFYLVSLYKVFGPHLGLLYVKREHLDEVANQNHFFVTEGDAEPAYKLEPGYVNHELTASLPGIIEYFEHIAGAAHHKAADTRTMLAHVFADIATHEEKLAGLLLDELAGRPGVRVLGPSTADARVRAPTIAFTVDGRHASEIATGLEQDRVAIRWGDFYARRAIDALDLGDRGGVVRVSMVHYNTQSEVERLIGGLNRLLGPR